MEQVVGKQKIITIYRDQVIGSGRMCKVFVGCYDKQTVAVKRIDSMEARFEKEADELRKLRHQNVVHYHFFDSDDNFEYIVTEKCECSLDEYLKNPEVLNIRPTNLQMMKDISLGVHYLHSANRIHRNIHPSNILLSCSSGGIVAKISDFGIIKHSIDGSSVGCSGNTGSLRYNNPEESRKKTVNMKSDIFSLGLCFYAILTMNGNPYGPDDVEISKSIHDGKSPNLSPISGEFNGYAEILIFAMLKYSCGDRPNAAEVLSHYLFWDSFKKIEFLQQASDAVKGERALARRLDEAVSYNNWLHTLYDCLEGGSVDVLQEHFNKVRPCSSRGEGLLRQVRNWCHHFNELTPWRIRHVLGGTKQNMIEMVLKMFPRLLPATYNVFQARRDESDFKRFYRFESPPRA